MHERQEMCFIQMTINCLKKKNFTNHLFDPKYTFFMLDNLRYCFQFFSKNNNNNKTISTGNEKGVFVTGCW